MIIGRVLHRTCAFALLLLAQYFTHATRLSLHLPDSFVPGAGMHKSHARVRATGAPGREHARGKRNMEFLVDLLLRASIVIARIVPIQCSTLCYALKVRFTVKGNSDLIFYRPIRGDLNHRWKYLESLSFILNCIKCVNFYKAFLYPEKHKQSLETVQ